MKIVLLFLTLLGVSELTQAQPGIIWSKNFETGLQNYYYKLGPDLQVKSDTINVIGRKNTPSGQRLSIVKYDLNGDTISTHCYGDDSVFNNTLIDYKFDSFNNVYLLQKENVESYKSKIVVQKYALNGALMWVKQIGSPADTSYAPSNIAIVNDTCFFITGYKEHDYPAPGDDVILTQTQTQMYAYNSNGNQLWKRDFTVGIIYYFLEDLVVYDNSAYFFTYGGNMIKVDVNNNLSANSNTGIIGGVNNVFLTTDTCFLISSGFNFRISKTDINGALIWSHYYGTNYPQNSSGDRIVDVTEDENGNTYVTGRHQGDEYGTINDSKMDILTLKYDNMGNLVWENRYEWGFTNVDMPTCITLKNGNIYVGGLSTKNNIVGLDYYDYVLLKMDAATGAYTGGYRYDGIANEYGVITSVHVLDNGNIVLTGLSSMNSQYGWETQLLGGIVLSLPTIDKLDNYSIYPNPIQKGKLLSLTGSDFFEYSIISLQGEIVQNGSFNNQLNTIRIGEHTPGVYILQLKTEKEVLRDKIVIAN